MPRKPKKRETDEEFNGLDPETLCEARSDDEGDTGEDLKDFIVNDEEEDEENGDDENVTEEKEVEEIPPPSLIVEGKRVRKPVKRYIDEIADEINALYSKDDDDDDDDDESTEADEDAEEEDEEEEEDQEEEEDEDEDYDPNEDDDDEEEEDENETESEEEEEEEAPPKKRRRVALNRSAAPAVTEVPNVQESGISSTSCQQESEQKVPQN